LWRKFINFEKSNPLRSEETALVSRRVMFATEQCLLVLSHHPDVWIMAAQYLDQTAKHLTEKAVRIQRAEMNAILFAFISASLIISCHLMHKFYYSFQLIINLL